MLPRLLVDENSAQLSRWLRFYGFDALGVFGLTDPEVSRLARHEGRVLITRDTELVARHLGPAIHLRSDDLRQQLRSVLVPPRHSPDRKVVHALRRVQRGTRTCPARSPRPATLGSAVGKGAGAGLLGLRLVRSRVLERFTL